MVLLLPLNKIEDEPWYFWSRNEDRLRWRLVAFHLVSEGQSDFDNKPSDSFKQYNDDGHLRKDPGMLQSTNFWFGEDAEIIFYRGISSFSGRTEGLKLLMPFRAANDLGDQPRELPDGDMPCKALVVDPVRAIVSVSNDSGIL